MPRKTDPFVNFIGEFIAVVIALTLWIVSIAALFSALRWLISVVA